MKYDTPQVGRLAECFFYEKIRIFLCFFAKLWYIKFYLSVYQLISMADSMAVRRLFQFIKFDKEGDGYVSIIVLNYTY